MCILQCSQFCLQLWTNTVLGERKKGEEEMESRVPILRTLTLATTPLLQLRLAIYSCSHLLVIYQIQDGWIFHLASGCI